MLYEEETFAPFAEEEDSIEAPEPEEEEEEIEDFE